MGSLYGVSCPGITDWILLKFHVCSGLQRERLSNILLLREQYGCLCGWSSQVRHANRLPKKNTLLFEIKPGWDLTSVFPAASGLFSL